MGGGDAKREQQEQQRRLEEIQRQQQQQQTQFIQLAAEKDPLTERLRSRDMAFLDWADQRDEAGNAVPLDVRRAPGLGPALGLYDAAKRGQNEERMGIGALRMGVQGSNPNLVSLLQEQRGARREQEAAGQLEGAVRTREAEATGSILPLAQMQQNQRMGLASLTSGNAQNTLGNLSQYVARPRQRSFWQDLLLTGVGGASAMGSAFLGRPPG